MGVTSLPQLPVPLDGLADYIAKHPETAMPQLMEPYRKFEAQLREVYAQERTHPALDDPYLNALPLFTKNTPKIQARARNPEAESQEERDKYVMPLPDDKRRPSGSPAVVESLKEFRHNFSVFSESSMADMDWDNVIAAGSSVVNCLLPVPPVYKKSKRALRQYYHEKFCPASDVDLFLYGLDEDQAIEKIKDIESRIRDAILSEVTVVRTKNAITICSQYPTRHVQIVLRVYKSVSEILTGFDIDCSTAAYDGKQVYCTPRALASYITQINPIDLSRRSPSYENRLSKYSHRNFEVYWPELDRSRIDPTIYERSFQRTLGLARLLVLERLPTTTAREQYLKKRREERGRPALQVRYQHRLFGNIKHVHEDEVADWVDEDEVSNYHTFTIPYGVKFHAKKIEKLCYTKDLLLNAEWNQPEEREVYLHRHPAFFGDCCGTCPKPVSTEEIEVAEKESEIYVSGKVSFRIDDPGRQQIGSFNPLTEDDWTEMAYVGNTARLCQAIVDGDLEHVEDWLSQEGADPNKRDYTGRTPLHLAVTSSTPAVVKCLVERGARLVARIADGRTALHLAAGCGNAAMVKILLEKSSANEEEEEQKQAQRRKTEEDTPQDSQDGQRHEEANAGVSDHDTDEDDEGSESDGELIENSSADDDGHSMATGLFVKVRAHDTSSKKDEAIPLDDDQNSPDYYKIDTVAWDSKCSALHLAILGGHCGVVNILCQEFGADVLIPVKIGDDSSPRAAILTLVLAIALPVEKAVQMSETLLSLGATSSQADVNGVTGLHRYVQNGIPKLVETLWAHDKLGLKTAINHVAVTGYAWRSSATSPLMTAIDESNPIFVLKLLEAGANPVIDFDTWLKGAKFSYENQLGNYERNQERFMDGTEQPLLVAIQSPHPAIAIELLKKGADPNTLTKASHNIIRNAYARRNQQGQTALDLVRELLMQLRKYEGEPDEPTQQSGARRHELGARFMLTSKRFSNERPDEPQGTNDFLANFTEGTYQHWLVSTDIDERMDSYKHHMKELKKQEEKNKGLRGLAEKKEAIADVVSELEKVEKALETKGAKTFKELHPEVEDPGPLRTPARADAVQEPYKLDFIFYNSTDVTESRKVAYLQLFEAAWSGNLDKIKSLSLAPWVTEQQEPPLQIAVYDAKGNNPFSLAFLKGHLKVAKAILEIAQAQWAPKEEKKARFTMVSNEEDDDDTHAEPDAGTDDEPQIYKEVIDDRFTIDNIGQVSMQVKSNTLPITMLSWTAPAFVSHEGEVVKTMGRQDLFAFSVTQGDTQRFNYLVDLGIQFTSQKPQEEDGSDRFFVFPDVDFNKAIQPGRTHMLAEVIRKTGAGIPLEHLVKKSGVELKVKPRCYQGLTVYGKKRADWANASRNLMLKPTGSNIPPFLTAAVEGSLESVEWFISDAPMRHYLEFGKSKIAKEDPRLRHLNEAPGGFDRAIMKWLGVQNDLVIHCAVLGPLGDNTNKLIEYLIKVCPSSFEAKSEQGYTPLYLAALLGEVQFAKTLINAGADQSVKDKENNNIIHAALTNNPNIKQLRRMLGILDPELRPHLFRQRNHLTHGGDTPLHFWLNKANVLEYTWDNTGDFDRSRRILRSENADNVKLLTLLLEFSKGAELDSLNGRGDTVLHSAVLRHLPDHSRVLLQQDPNLLYRENTVGRIPGEIAYDIYINSKVEGLEPIEISRQVSHATSLVERSPEMFVQDEHAETSGAKRKERTWEVVYEYLAKVDGKRRLVSLNEANDVAKRLGENYSSQRYFQRSTAADEEPEEEQDKPEKESDFVAIRYSQTRFQAWAVEEGEEDDEELASRECPRLDAEAFFRFKTILRILARVLALIQLLLLDILDRGLKPLLPDIAQALQTSNNSLLVKFTDLGSHFYPRVRHDLGGYGSDNSTLTFEAQASRPSTLRYCIRKRPYLAIWSNIDRSKQTESNYLGIEYRDRPVVSVTGLTAVGILLHYLDLLIPKDLLQLLKLLCSGSSRLPHFYTVPDTKQTVLHLLAYHPFLPETGILEYVLEQGRGAGLHINIQDAPGDTPLTTRPDCEGAGSAP
ncbi:Uu.00g015960.m01.CDS01 [Anthostomella pinea]|uniref:Uu.00g015960.m01.CDS01 n=1 Tax=Anthostomella pinea TaxID=933095 RepID=A0AAI8VYM3_9PEZI|nr:Uu.00g015960.m01.CDS01 [Anthostomella pinea]